MRPVVVSFLTNTPYGNTESCLRELLRRRRKWCWTALLVLGFLVTGVLLLAEGEVPSTKAMVGARPEAESKGSWSGLAALSGPLTPFAERARAPGPSPVSTVVPQSTFTPTPFRRLRPSPTPVPHPTPDGTTRRAIVPVLMYHHVSIPPTGADYLRKDLSVSPDDFEAQLRYLIENGYAPITLSGLIMHLQTGQPLPSNPVILTFDDGFKDQYTNAYPLLKKYGFVATFFIITGFADEGRDGCMSWADVELLHADGMEIGSHSYTHPNLAGRSFDYVVWQTLGSKEAIEARTHQPVRFFSYPSGQYDQQVMDVLRSEGYWGAVTVEAGSLQSSQHTFELRRIRVRGRYSLTDFAYWLNYWLAHP